MKGGIVLIEMTSISERFINLHMNKGKTREGDESCKMGYRLRSHEGVIKQGGARETNTHKERARRLEGKGLQKERETKDERREEREREREG